jgi:hypothetical protein
VTEKEDPLARIHREYRQQCKEWGTYRPLTESQMAGFAVRWRQESQRKLEASQAKPQRRRPNRTARET